MFKEHTGIAAYIGSPTKYRASHSLSSLDKDSTYADTPLILQGHCGSGILQTIKPMVIYPETQSDFQAGSYLTCTVSAKTLLLCSTSRYNSTSAQLTRHIMTIRTLHKWKSLNKTGLIFLF